MRSERARGVCRLGWEERKDKGRNGQTELPDDTQQVGDTPERMGTASGQCGRSMKDQPGGRRENTAGNDIRSREVCVTQ